MYRHVKGNVIQDCILHHLDDNPTNIVDVVAAELPVPRHRVNRHVRRLVNDGIIESMGLAGQPYYALKVFHNKEFRVFLSSNTPQVEQTWLNEIEPMLAELPENVLSIWRYGFNAILHNAEIHSDADSVLVCLKKTALTVEISLLDDGQGIFQHLCRALQLPDESCAVDHILEHWQSRAESETARKSISRAVCLFDQIVILSGQTYLSYKRSRQDPPNMAVRCQAERAGLNKGTLVSIKLFNDVKHGLSDYG
ncbi:MAG: hypothetical protein AAF512_02300 [Pseudomonadota bacterium]